MNLSYGDNIIIYMNNYVINSVDFTSNESIKEYFKNIFLRLKKILNIELSGFYIVKIYKDINGLVIEFENEDEYYDIYDEIDMKIVLEETTFLYSIEDIFVDSNILKKTKILKYNNKLYLQVINTLTNKEIGYLHEMSKLIYKNTENIIKYGRELPLNLV